VAVTLLEGDCRALLPTLPAESVHCVVTSPPYWGLRDYGTATWEGGDVACDHFKLLGGTGAQNLGKSAEASAANVERSSVAYRERCGKCGARRLDQQLGLEPTPEAYIENMVGVFREVRRVLRDDGTLWLNMGDSYASDPASGGPGQQDGGEHQRTPQRPYARPRSLKPKDLVGIPWRLAFGLQADGWYLRADIIWAKPNPMPESVTDRPTKAHEYVFLLAKAARYFYDADAVREPHQGIERPAFDGVRGTLPKSNGRPDTCDRAGNHPAGRNLRSVWTIPSAPFPDAHFATFPPALASRCIQAGTSERGCCRVCGAPWTRQTSIEQVVLTGSSGKIGDGQRNPATRTDLMTQRTRKVVDTIGWQPSCACDAGPPVPCTVLDPFAGSGTVGQVAEQLGRHSVLCELSPAYVQMAAERTAQCGLFTGTGYASAPGA
jgi:DNA modification methylase